MAKIVCIGEYDAILPFKAIGAEIYPVKTGEEASKIATKLVKEDVSIILISDEFLPHIQLLISLLKEKTMPCIVSIPSKTGTKYGVNMLREMVKKAVGLDIMKE